MDLICPGKGTGMTRLAVPWDVTFPEARWRRVGTTVAQFGNTTIRVG
jgi:hypothetical protein